MKVSYVSIIESLRSSRGPSATFLSKDQAKPESTFKLILSSYKTAYMYKAGEVQT